MVHSRFTTNPAFVSPNLLCFFTLTADRIFLLHFQTIIVNHQLGMHHPFVTEEISLGASLSLERFIFPTGQSIRFIDCQIKLRGGTVTLLYGDSGTGKSTLLNCFLPEPPGTMVGTVSFSSPKFGLLSPKQAASFGLIGTSSPDSALLPWLNVRQNLQLPSQLNGRIRPALSSEIEELLSALCLDSVDTEKFPFELSFGMRQRISLARAILYRHPFVLLDEVTSGLDETNALNLCDQIYRKVKSENLCCLLVTHFEKAQRFADNAFLIEEVQSVHGTERIVRLASKI